MKRTARNVDAIAERASQGHFRVVLSGVEAMFAFAGDGTEAKAIEDSYEGAFQVLQSGDGKLERHGPLVVAWTTEPDDSRQSVVDDCLREG